MTHQKYTGTQKLLLSLRFTLYKILVSYCACSNNFFKRLLHICQGEHKKKMGFSSGFGFSLKIFC